MRVQWLPFAKNNIFSPVGFKGNLSLLEIVPVVFQGAKKQMEDGFCLAEGMTW